MINKCKEKFYLLGLGFILMTSFPSLADENTIQSEPNLTTFSGQQQEYPSQDLKTQELALRKILSENPQIAEAHLNLGNVYWAQGRDGKPIRHYLAAIKLNPNYAEAYYNLGNVFFTQGEKEKAVKAYSKAIELKADFAPAYNGLGNAFTDTKEYSKAIENYKKSIELNPMMKESHHNLCTAYLYSAQYEEAIEACKQALTLYKDAAIYNNLGNAYFRTQQFDLAIDAYNKALEINPELSEAHFNIAAINLVDSSRRNIQEALSRKKMLEKLDPQKSRKLTTLIKASEI